MRLPPLVRVSLVLALGAALGLVAGADMAASQDVPQTPSGFAYFFVQPAAGGSLEPIMGAPGQYRLTLNHVSPSIVYFSDRPAREVGQVAPQTLVANWGTGPESLAAVPPNAALDFLDGPAGQSVVVLELYEPAYDPATQTMTYRAAILPSSDRPGLADLVGRGVPPVAAFPREFGPAVLFIDDVCLSCW